MTAPSPPPNKDPSNPGRTTLPATATQQGNRMADDVDVANDRLAISEADAVREVQRKAAKIPKGEPGDCDECGEYFARLVDGHCGYCRDRRIGLKRNRS